MHLFILANFKNVLHRTKDWSCLLPKTHLLGWLMMLQIESFYIAKKCLASNNSSVYYIDAPETHKEETQFRDQSSLVCVSFVTTYTNFIILSIFSLFIFYKLY
jgi:hypothetical protein